MASEGIFSVLSNDLVHEIFSYINLKQRTITYLVSKKWYQMIKSMEDHKFVQIQCANKYSSSKSSRNFVKFHPIVKFATDNTNLTEFYLLVPDSGLFHFSLEKLDSRLLTVLHLKCCTVNEIGFSWFPSLKEICFNRVHIDPSTLFELILKCPSIVELSLIRCCYLYQISVPHQDQLRKVYVNYDKRYLEKIEIKARNLMEFHLFSSSLSVEIDLRACTKLQIMELDCQYKPIGFPNDISFEFPYLKSLSLRLFKNMKKINLLSYELENLILTDMPDLDEAIIDTPNLRSFKLITMEKVPSWCPVVGSRLMEVEIGLKNARTTNCLIDLRVFTGNLGGNISLSFDTTELKKVKSRSKNLQNNIGPLSIKHLTLEVLSPLIPRYESLIDKLFSYFHPQTLLVSVDSDPQNCNFIQVLLNELKGQTNRSKRYKSSNYMYWCNALKSFEILESTITIKEGAHRLSLELHWYLPVTGIPQVTESVRRSTRVRKNPKNLTNFV